MLGDSLNMRYSSPLSLSGARIGFCFVLFVCFFCFFLFFFVFCIFEFFFLGGRGGGGGSFFFGGMGGFCLFVVVVVVAVLRRGGISWLKLPSVWKLSVCCCCFSSSARKLFRCMWCDTGHQYCRSSHKGVAFAM